MSPYRETLDYWRSYAHGVRPLTIPGMDGPTDHAEVTLKATIGARTCSRVHDIARKAGTTAYSVLLTVFSWMLQQETGHEDIPVLATHHYRHNADLEDVIGLFFELVLVRGHFPPGMTFDKRLAETGAAISNTMRHLDVPMFALAEEIEELSTYLLNPFVCFELIPEQQGLDLPGARNERKELFTPGYQVTKFVSHVDHAHRTRGRRRHSTRPGLRPGGGPHGPDAGAARPLPPPPARDDG